MLSYNNPRISVSGLDKDSRVDLTGLKVGDCVLEVNGEDILGLRISEVASLVRSKSANVTLLLWTSSMDPSCSPDSLCCGPMPLNLDRLSSCVQTILAALECPICLDTIPPPVIQCINGHLVCIKCRARSERCPICRHRYNSGRSLIAEQVYSAIMDSFKLREEDGKLRERLFGAQCRKSHPAEHMKTTVQSHTHKFLAKIMGKATSMDSLSSSAKSQNVPTNEMITNKHLSLSANEIFRPNSSAPTSRSTSPHPIAGSQTFLGSRRPKSHNASMESLASCEPSATGHHHNHNESIRLETSLAQYYCPCSEVDCGQKMGTHQLKAHITNVHRVPIISFGHSSAEVCLPPRAPVENACLLLHLETVPVWVKLKYMDGEYFIAALMQSSVRNESGDDADLDGFYLEVIISNDSNAKKIYSKEIVMRSEIHSLETKSWANVLADKNGLVITNECISSTLDANADVMLKASVKRI